MIAQKATVPDEGGFFVWIFFFFSIQKAYTLPILGLIRNHNTFSILPGLAVNKGKTHLQSPDLVKPRHAALAILSGTFLKL